MSTTASKTRVVMSLNGSGDRTTFEAPATDNAIIPGHLLVLLSTGKVDGGISPLVAVALENPYQDPGYLGSNTPLIDTAYATNATVPYIVPQAGDVLNLVAKASENFDIGTKVAANSSGEALGWTNEVTYVGIALEDKTAAASGVSRIKVMIAAS